MSHTPGPWEVDPCGFIVAPQPEPDEDDCPMYEVASVGNGTVHLTRRETADARLIAAAPDLLAVLKEWFTANTIAEAMLWQQRARDVIAKAEGK